MSLLQNEEFIIYNLRSSYLSHIKDGVGERLISINQGVFNTPGFRAAGWSPNPAEIKRTYSPPIPTAIASEYFQAPPRSAGQPPPGFGDDDDEGGMVTGGGASGDTVGPPLNTRRKRRRELLQEEDSSDLSDESDEDGEGTQRAAQQIRFAKMPVRTRAGSSPIRKSSGVHDSALATSPSRPQEDNRFRRGSLGAVEAMKERARKARMRSSELSSENELDGSGSESKHDNPFEDGESAEPLSRKMVGTGRQSTMDSTELEDEDSGGESDGTSLSSEFAEADDTPSILDGVANPLASSPLSNIQGPIAPQTVSPRKTRAAPNVLQALPPPRPISVIQPVSALTLALKAKRSKAVSPFERFATLSGEGDPNPLNLKIYAPFSEGRTEPFEVAIRKFIREENTAERKVTVVDAIGLSLWRYSEENISPPVTGDKMNVNRWMLRMVEDGEVDYDFPPLDRTKAMDDFAFNNNRAARTRATTKAYDEFALVEATEEQFRENEQLTPNPVQPASVLEEEEDDITPQPSPNPVQFERHNPVLGREFGNPALRNNSITPADLPYVPVSHATPRKGPSKILKIHFTSAEGYPQLVALDVTTDTYLAEVLDTVCKRRNLDKALHVLKVSNTNVLAPLDRTVEAIGDREDVDLVRRRFGNDGPISITGSPTSNTPPNAPLLIIPESRKGHKKGTTAPKMLHPLAQSQHISSDALLLGGLGGGTGTYKRYTVWRRQPMSFMPTHERILVIDGEYLHIMPAEPVGGGGGGGGGGANKSSTIFFDPRTAAGFGAAKTTTTTIHFSSIVGCKCSRKHPSHFRVVVYPAHATKASSRDNKRYDFEAHSPDEALEIVDEIKRGFAPFQNVGV